MTTNIIITLCVLLLLAYVFDLTSAKTKIPSVFVLLLLGWIVRQITVQMDIKIINLSVLLPLLGKIGLILIVLEGSLELKMERSKVPLMKKSFLLALLPMLVLTFLLSYIFKITYDTSMKASLLSAIPLAIISSSVAISSVRNFNTYSKDFVIYESSLSDILGVVFFNFVLINDIFNAKIVFMFGFEIIVILIISLIATIILAFLLHYIDHSVKFLPIIILIIFIYTVLEEYHLPELIFVMIFGILLENAQKFVRFHKILTRLQMDMDILHIEVEKFKEIIMEGTFLVRTCFFLLFGYLIETNEIMDLHTLAWAVGIMILILAVRFLFLKFFKIPIQPLLFIAPRGLITILLFLSIPAPYHLSVVSRPLLIQLIILSTLTIMIGSFMGGKESHKITTT